MSYEVKNHLKYKNKLQYDEMVINDIVKKNTTWTDETWKINECFEGVKILDASHSKSKQMDKRIAEMLIVEIIFFYKISASAQMWF